MRTDGCPLLLVVLITKRIWRLGFSVTGVAWIRVAPASKASVQNANWRRAENFIVSFCNDQNLPASRAPTEGRARACAPHGKSTRITRALKSFACLSARTAACVWSAAALLPLFDRTQGPLMSGHVPIGFLKLIYVHPSFPCAFLAN